MARDLVVIGGGEHARVVIDAARSRPDLWNVLGFVDPQSCTETARLVLATRLGDEDEGLRLAALDVAPLFVVGVGGIGPGSRRPGIAERFAARGVRWAAVVHAKATVSPYAEFGDGVVVCAGAIVNPGAVIGMHAILNTASVVEHDVRIGDYAQLAPRAVVAGGATIGYDAYIGAGAVVRDHTCVGDRAMVAMGAVVTRDVADGATVAGCPARPLSLKTK